MLPTLHRHWPEVLLCIAGGFLLLAGLFQVSPSPAFIRGPGGMFLPHLAAQSVLDHSRAWAVINGGYPASFQPLEGYFLRLGLTRGPAWWTCAGSVRLADLPQSASLRQALEFEELEPLLNRAPLLARRFNLQPGQFIYIPWSPQLTIDPVWLRTVQSRSFSLQPLPREQIKLIPAGEGWSTEHFSNCILLLREYPEEWSNAAEAAYDIDTFDHATLTAARDGYRVLLPRFPLDPAVRQVRIRAHPDGGFTLTLPNETVLNNIPSSP